MWNFISLQVSFSQPVDVTCTTITLQWNSHIRNNELNSEHQLKYFLQYSKSNDQKMKETKLLSMGNLVFNNEQATYQYTIHDLCPNTSYQFKVAVINKLEIKEGEYAEIEGECAKIEVCTSKTHAYIAMYIAMHIQYSSRKSLQSHTCHLCVFEQNSWYVFEYSTSSAYAKRTQGKFVNIYVTCSKYSWVTCVVPYVENINR